MFLRCALPATRLTPCSFVAYSVEFAPHFVPQAYALSSPSVILDVLNPKMFVKTCVFRHSFSCHFFFCVVFKEHFASIFSVLLRCCSEMLVRVARYAFLAFPSLRLAIRKISSQKLFASAFFRITSPFLEKFVRVALLRVPLFSSSCLVLREKSFAKTRQRVYIPSGEGFPQN